VDEEELLVFLSPICIQMYHKQPRASCWGHFWCINVLEYVENKFCPILFSFPALFIPLSGPRAFPQVILFSFEKVGFFDPLLFYRGFLN
jgi:hypothetical protein